MGASSETTYSHEFSWMKMYEFWLRGLNELRVKRVPVNSGSKVQQIQAALSLFAFPFQQPHLKIELPGSQLFQTYN